MGKYTHLFINESRSHLETLAGYLKEAVGGMKDEHTLFESRRLSHSIKGMALFEEQQTVADLAFALEKGFQSFADGAGSALHDDLVRGVELLQAMIDEVDHDGSPHADPGELVEAIGRHEKA